MFILEIRRFRTRPGEHTGATESRQGMCHDAMRQPSFLWFMYCPVTWTVCADSLQYAELLDEPL